jgi:hypothetical protein
MTLLRLLAILLGLSLIIGDALIVAAQLVRMVTWASHALFTGACALNPGNFDLGVLTALIGLAFVTAIIGFLFSLRVPLAGNTQ